MHENLDSKTEIQLGLRLFLLLFWFCVRSVCSRSFLSFPRFLSCLSLFLRLLLKRACEARINREVVRKHTVFISTSGAAAASLSVRFRFLSFFDCFSSSSPSTSMDTDTSLPCAAFSFSANFCCMSARCRTSSLACRSAINKASENLAKLSLM